MVGTLFAVLIGGGIMFGEDVVAVAVFGQVFATVFSVPLMVMALARFESRPALNKTEGNVLTSGFMQIGKTVKLLWSENRAVLQVLSDASEARRAKRGERSAASEARRAKRVEGTAATRRGWAERKKKGLPLVELGTRLLILLFALLRFANRPERSEAHAGWKAHLPPVVVGPSAKRRRCHRSNLGRAYSSSSLRFFASLAQVLIGMAFNDAANGNIFVLLYVPT
jgi:hypothetical protein